MAAASKPKTPMEHYNMSDLLRGQASKIITKIANEDKQDLFLKMEGLWQF